MEQFQILHGSDLHYSRDPLHIGVLDSVADPAAWNKGRPGWVSSHDPDVSEAFAIWAHTCSSRFDVIILTGDIATSGEGDDLQAAHRFVASPAFFRYKDLNDQPTLQGSGKRVLVLPGNHDRYDSRFGAKPGNTAFDRTFAAGWHCGQSVQELWNEPKGDERLAILGADFSLASGERPRLPRTYEGCGRVYQDRLDSLCDLTASVRHAKPGCGVIWAVHFDPEAAPVWLELIDSKKLLDAARAQAVGAILCGHTHASRNGSASPPIYVCGTTTQLVAPDKNRFQIVTIDVDSKNGGVCKTSVVCYTYEEIPYVGHRFKRST